MKGWLEFVNLVSEKDLEITSAMILACPSMCIVCGGDVWLMCCLKASALRRCPAILEVVVHFLFAHDTVDMLSQKMPTCLCCIGIGVVCSRTSQCISIAASSKSFIDIVPLGFDSDTRLFITEAGSLNFQIM